MSVSGTSTRSLSQASIPSRASAKVPPHLAIRCRECGELCQNQEALVSHRLYAMKNEGTHVHCPVCNMDFQTMETQRQHLVEMHPYDQNLVCPGCERNFVRLAGWMKHLEHNECPAIKGADVDKNRAEKLSFAHELEKRSGSQFGDYFPVSHPSVRSATNVVSKPYMAHPSFFKPEDFPKGKNGEGSTQKDENGEPSTTLSAPAFPDVSKAVDVDINNPYHPAFNANKYYNGFTRKYKCPQSSCNKSFASSQSLVAHMKSSMSHYNAKLQCPGCLRWFKDASSLTAHSESESNRCFIRRSEDYRTYLDQLTGGMADVVEKRDDGTLKYEVSTEAVIKFGPTQMAKKATENLMAKKEAERQEHWTRNNPVW